MAKYDVVDRILECRQAVRIYNKACFTVQYGRDRSFGPVAGARKAGEGRLAEKQIHPGHPVISYQ